MTPEELSKQLFDYIDERQQLYIDRLGEAVAYVKIDAIGRWDGFLHSFSLSTFVAD
jgi:hypothetical protein